MEQHFNIKAKPDATGEGFGPPAPALPLAHLPAIHLAAPACQDLRSGGSREWLVANGLGGYASSTVLGMNTRRAHGLLVAALRPPVGRMCLLSKVEETVVAPFGRFELSCNRYAGMVHPDGWRYLVEFRLDPWPTFFYRMGQTVLAKTVFMLPGENAVVVGYTLVSAPGPVELVLRPLTAFRDPRFLSREDPSLKPRVEESPGEVRLQMNEDGPVLVFHHTAELVQRSGCWYKNFEYPEEPPAREDLWSFGQFLYLLKVGESCALVASTGRRGGVDLAFHERRLVNTQQVLAQTMSPPGEGPLARRLSWSGESFLAQCGASESFLLAGWPPLAPWGRDTLIALPGLFLSTRRFEAARGLLATLAGCLKDGLLPVRFTEEGLPEYDSADTSLWFFWAVWHYLKATRDLKFVAKKLLAPMREILEAYLEGTSFGIGMDDEGLMELKDETLALTWMDSREPGRGPEEAGPPVTPRGGKPVEINALWYCALSVMARVSDRLQLKRSATYRKLAHLVGRNFARTFHSPQGLLYDRVSERGADSAIRPNLLIAASLPFTPLSRSLERRILEEAERSLLTPAGIRSLAPGHPAYRGRYEGDASSRALSYHQGTVWTWLWGPYAATVLKVRGVNRQTQAALKKQLSFLIPHLEAGGLGGVPEIFDGDPPHQPRGGLSQAWAAGELLRVIAEAKLTDA
ncbi:MAG: glycogen debranching enzyme family protein [Candidatus Omnitrophica bacterium]|nr:glycogen debranching enzyme family protein [Candidatus Omnitrophota bacterium]